MPRPFKTYYKKRAARKTRRTGKRKCYVSPCVKKYVKGYVHRQIENKVHVAYGANQPVVNGATPTALYALPNPGQGTAVHQRIGQVINLRKSTIKIIFNLLPYNAVTNPIPTAQLVKVWLCSCKGVNTNSIGATSIATNFFESTGGTTMGPQQNTVDMVASVNTDAWTVYQTRYFKLGATSNSSPIGNTGYFDSSPMSKAITFNINKHVKMLKFDSTSFANNRNLFIVMMTCNADGTTSGTQAVEYHYGSRWEFEDA